MNQANIFRCKQFQVVQAVNVMKVNSDGMLLGAWANVDDHKYILDIGTGTGIIALMLAQRTKDSIIHGVEIDAAAAIEAGNNFSNSIWSDRMESIQMAIQDYSSLCNIKYDKIVSNPPFFSGGTFSGNENKNNVRHTTKLSHGDLLISVSKLLAQNGQFDIILPYLEGERFIELASRYDLFERRVTNLRPRKDKPIERLLISLGRKNQDSPRDDLIMYDSKENGHYSEAYKNITKDFYLKF